MSAAETTQGELTRLFWRAKARLAVNYLRNIRRYIYVHMAVGFVVLLFVIAGGYGVFHFLFRWLLDSDRQPFGEPLMRRLVGMVLLAFFSMLTFSNLIIMLTTSYISREVEFYLAQPFTHRRLFFCKFGESVIYSSWAFAALSMPFFVALGTTAPGGASLLYYPVTAALLIPFILIPSALGGIATLLLTAFVPAKKTFRFVAALAGVTIALALSTGRLSNLGRRLEAGDPDIVIRAMDFLSAGDAAWIPSTWLARGLRGAMEKDWGEAAFWGGALFATALFMLQICHALSRRLYYRGYCTSRTSSSGQRTRRGGLFAFFNGLTLWLRPSLRALVVKDLTVFWRDPAQWGQLVVLFGLLFLYISNLGNIANLQAVQLTEPIWQGFTTLLNVGAICFVLSILSTRFFYPMLSLEGRQQWVIGLAPLERTRLVWVKFGVCWTSSLFVTLPLMLLSCIVLGTSGFVTGLSFVTVLAMSLGLTSLATGLGAMLPNFGEDNPARIANGLGGTINVVLSMIYIMATIALEVPLVWRHIRGGSPETPIGWAIMTGSIAAWVMLHACVIALPMWLGLRKWGSLEF